MKAFAQPGRLAALLVALLATLPTGLQAADMIKIDRITSSGGTVSLQFTDSRPTSVVGLSHTVQFTRFLGPATAWTNVSAVTFSNLPSSSFGRVAVLPGSTPTGFYRVIGNTANRGVISIDHISRSLGTTYLEFTDQRLATNPVLNHSVEFTRFLGPAAAWTNVSGVSFAKLSVNKLGRSVTVPASTPTGFYRVVGTTFSSLGTTNDPDGDGLSNSLEASLGTNANLWDSDGDGFSDGVEYQYGTNPNDPTSFPILTTLPRAEFAVATSLATEGNTPHGVTVRFDKPYIGNLKIGVLTNSTAVAGVDYQALPSSVTVAGTEVVIPVTWIDDAVIKLTRLLILEIRTDQTQPYARAGQTVHTIVLNDNDAYWSGVLADTYAQRNFRLKLVHVGGVSQATFVAGAGNDGMPLLASDTNVVKSSQSAGIVPIGTHSATVQFDATNHFKITSPAMPAATGGLFGPSTGLTRSLILDSFPAANGPPNDQSIIPGRIIGNYTECLSIPPGPCATQTGDFVLVKDLPTRPNINP